MKNKNVFIVLGIIALIALAIFLNNKGVFSILPQGGYTANSDCTFITNLDSLDSRYTAYASSGVWISAEPIAPPMRKWGFKVLSQDNGARASACTVQGNNNILFKENINSAGDDVYYYTSMGYLYVCSSDGHQYAKFEENYGAASNAITSCENPSTPFTCSYIGEAVCADATHRQVCNSEYRLGGLLLCGSGSYCENGQCITGPSCTESWSCGSWSACSNGIQVRACTDANNCGTTSNKPSTSQSCSGGTPTCTAADYQYSLTPCTNGQQTKVWTQVGNCQGGYQKPANEVVSCNSGTPTCTSFTYSDYGTCQPSGIKTRTILTSSPSGCSGGNSETFTTCTYSSGNNQETGNVCDANQLNIFSSCISLSWIIGIIIAIVLILVIVMKR